MKYLVIIIPIAILCLHPGCDKDDPVSPIDDPGKVTDIDGNEYQAVKIGDQWWMAENLKVSRYRNGDQIRNVTGNTQWSFLLTGAWAYYENDSSNDNTYGKLYNWFAVEDERGLCPKGWHVPTDREWTTLVNYLGGAAVAGGKMKSTRTEPDTHPRWKSPNMGATDESGFSGLPGGIRGSNGDFGYIGNGGIWWSSTEGDFHHVWFRSLVYDDSSMNRLHYGMKRDGRSVRCLMDE